MTTPTLPAARSAARAEAALRPPARHLLSAGDFAALGIEGLLDRAEGLRREHRRGRHAPLLAGRQVALLFDKPSLRTRVSFEVGIQQLGGNAIFLAPEEVQLGRREPAQDVARNLSRWVDAIVVRCSDPGTIRALAAAASVPVINALDDREHPCQALADLLTLRQHLGQLPGRRLAYVGDGNNVCHSLLVAGALAGMRVRVATPQGYAPAPEIVAAALRLGAPGGGSVQVGSDPAWAVDRADAVYTDVWTSMGFESQAEERRVRFGAYQVNDALLAGAPDALVMHCLPARRGEEITAAVLDGPRSVALDQAENRLYAQQALLVRLLAPR